MQVGQGVCASADQQKKLKRSQDGQSKGELDLGDDDPKIVKLMIDYLYQLDYDDVLPSENQPTADEPPSKQPDSPVARTVQFFESIASNEAPTEPAEAEPPPRTPWDYMLSTAAKRKKEKEMRFDGTWEGRLTQEVIDEDNATTEGLLGEDIITESMAEAEAATDVFEARSFSNKTSQPKEKSRLQDFVENPDAERLVVNVDLYTLADKYGIEDLKLLAKAKFSKAALQNWKSAAFVRAAELAFQNTLSTDLGLRSVVLRTVHEHLELTDYEEMQNLLDSGNGIAWQLVKVLRSESRHYMSRQEQING